MRKQAQKLLFGPKKFIKSIKNLKRDKKEKETTPKIEDIVDFNTNSTLVFRKISKEELEKLKIFPDYFNLNEKDKTTFGTGMSFLDKEIDKDVFLQFLEDIKQEKEFYSVYSQLLYAVLVLKNDLTKNLSNLGLETALFLVENSNITPEGQEQKSKLLFLYGMKNNSDHLFAIKSFKEAIEILESLNKLDLNYLEIVIRLGNTYVVDNNKEDYDTLIGYMQKAKKTAETLYDENHQNIPEGKWIH